MSEESEQTSLEVLDGAIINRNRIKEMLEEVQRQIASCNSESDAIEQVLGLIDEDMAIMCSDPSIETDHNAFGAFLEAYRVGNFQRAANEALKSKVKFWGTALKNMCQHLNRHNEAIVTMKKAMAIPIENEDVLVYDMVMVDSKDVEEQVGATTDFAPEVSTDNKDVN